MIHRGFAQLVNDSESETRDHGRSWALGARTAPNEDVVVILTSPLLPWHIRAPALLISRLVSWVDDLWCRAIGAGV
ncbi:hypothetical protein CKW46_14075 [Mycobacterium liflandii]|nr:hypothetical protein CKW46_14075 [Mycobacterium liflandii]